MTKELLLVVEVKKTAGGGEGGLLAGKDLYRNK